MKPYKKLFRFLIAAVFLIFLAAFQIAFLNPYFSGLNFFVILAIYLALTKNNAKAMVFSWFGGLLTSTSSFAGFGTNGLILLVFAAILILLRSTVFLAGKTANILMAAVSGIVIYHFLNWIIVNILAFFGASASGNIAFYFAGPGIFVELIAAIMILPLMLKIKKLKNG